MGRATMPSTDSRQRSVSRSGIAPWLRTKKSSRHVSGRSTSRRSGGPPQTGSSLRMMNDGSLSMGSTSGRHSERQQAAGPGEVERRGVDPLAGHDR